ncbi:hypothetical protein A6R68_04540 [Neotoma lepida]|uniref:Threonyl/alanyl tRNA synthetase SAD domain-containing protein n=1 Tax=Neotoma lepida TaxID=56216 RepID=A0A1A6GL65_NEOLE|nr:hypothetical protein A6R68_04540 [Neotoma lepida]
MAFLCQRDSYARELTTTVVSCSPAELQTDASGGKKEVLSGFQVVLEDTLLFPEGGGQVRGRGLPDDHAGPIRVVTIKGVDSNMCCGTHVSNLSDLQVIKILGTEKGKKNKSNLIFLAGNRVLKWMERSHGSEKALTTLLKYAPLPPLLPRPAPLGLGILPARGIQVVEEQSGWQKQQWQETLLFLTVGDEKAVSLTTSPFSRVAEVLEGKGAGKKGRFQGKATKMSRRAEVQALLQDYVSTQSAEE